MYTVVGQKNGVICECWIYGDCESADRKFNEIKGDYTDPSGDHLVMFEHDGFEEPGFYVDGYDHPDPYGDDDSIESDSYPEIHAMHKMGL